MELAPDGLGECGGLKLLVGSEVKPLRHMTQKPAVFPLWSAENISLRQGPPRRHHWKLRNLAQLAIRLAKACNYTSPAEFLLQAPIPQRADPAGPTLRFALMLQLCCNCWTIQASTRQPLLPEPPNGLRFLQVDRTWLQRVPHIGIVLTREDELTLVGFRGTTTVRESLLDLRASVSGVSSGVLKVFTKYYKKNRLGAKLRSALASGRVLVSGHSLGGAFASLCALQARDAGASTSLVTWGGARALTKKTCCELRRDPEMLQSWTILNRADFVPRLRSIAAKTCACCPVVLLDVEAAPTFLGRARVHDVLYYGYALLMLGSAHEKDKGLRRLVCAREDDDLKSCILPVPPFAPFLKLVRMESEESRSSDAVEKGKRDSAE